MKLVWKGRYTGEDQLKADYLPENAVKFKEPGSMLTLNLTAMLFVIPVIILVAVAVSIKMAMGTYVDYDFFGYVPLLFALLTIPFHELLHAVCFPKDAEVDIWFSLKHGIAFVHSTYPVSKKRFIFISLLPNLVFGIIPLFLWVVLPINDQDISSFLLSFASICLIIGAGDYMNVFNALTQMPKGTLTKLYGFNSYWYYPEKNQAEDSPAD